VPLRKKLRGRKTLRRRGFPRPACVCALVVLTTLLFGATPAWAGGPDLLRGADDPAFSPLERLLASRIGPLRNVPRPAQRPTKVLHFHVVLPKARARVQHHAQPKPRQRQIRHRLPRATPSFYVHSTAESVMRYRGCRAGQHRAFGIVILAFGKPYYNGHSYGTLTFSNRFASNREITDAMKDFARGYAACLPRGSRAHIALARGTSNYYTWVPSQFQAGRKWARETVVFARFLRSSGLDDKVASAAAIDAEPAWNPSFIRTRDFFRGYRAYGPGHRLYNYGSLDGGVGALWNARQIFYVSGGM
jgi:hypothetical protein